MQEVLRWFFQVWELFDKSHKHLAAYLKVQMSVKQLQEPSKEAKDECMRRLAKEISNLMIQTTEPIPKYTLLNPVSLLWTWHFKHGVYATNVPFPSLIIL